MVTIIKKGSSAKKILEQVKNLQKTKAVNELKKLCGAVKFDKDPIDLQRDWRNEWK